MIPTLLAYAPLLLVTLVLEITIVGALAPRGRRREAWIAAAALNLFTHPLATLLAWRWGVDFLALESLVFLFEWLCYGRLLRIGPLVALRLALPANLLSAVAGFLLWLSYIGP